MNLFVLPVFLDLALLLAMFAATAFALVHAATQRPDAFIAADKLNKRAWLIILGLSLAVQLLLWREGPIGLLHLVGIIATIVYLVDVRPALRSLTRY